MAEAGRDVPPARAIHDRLIALGIHPDPPPYSGPAALRPFSIGSSPCDGCVDLWRAGAEIAAAQWAGPRIRPSEIPAARKRPSHPASCYDREGKLECVCGLEDAEIAHGEMQADRAEAAFHEAQYEHDRHEPPPDDHGADF